MSSIGPPPGRPPTPASAAARRRRAVVERRDAAGARAQLLDPVLVGEDREREIGISAASRRAAVGSIEPSVSMSSVSLSKSVRWPTRACSTEYATRLTGEKIESIGMTPIGWSATCCPRPAGSRGRGRSWYSSSLVFFSSVAMCASGLRISTPEGRSMSRAVISPGPVTTSGASTSVASECIRQTIPLRFRTMSVTSSETPLIVENSCATPSIRTDVTAARRARRAARGAASCRTCSRSRDRAARR